MRRARWKRKNVRDELTALSVNSPKTGAGRHALSAKSRSLLPAAPTDIPRITAPRICGRGVHWGAKRTPSASLSADAPLIIRGVSKGEKPQFRPFVSFKGGAGGNRNPPAFLFRGPGGHSLFKREYPLGFSVPKRYSSAGNSGPMWEHQIKPARRTAPRCCCPSPLH